MPGEGIRSRAAAEAAESSNDVRITVRGRTVRIHLTGILDRPGAARLIQAANRVLATGRYLVVLDAARLVHLDYRCVPMLVRWRRGLDAFGHRLVLERWNEYLRAILAMEDWEGELERGMSGSASGRRSVRPAPVQAP